MNIKMTKSEFLDAKHIADYAINVYNASAADTGDLFLLCLKEIGFQNSKNNFKVEVWLSISNWRFTD